MWMRFRRISVESVSVQRRRIHYVLHGTHELHIVTLLRA
jgi:hypothetical protein